MIDKQRNAIIAAQDDIDEDREESERLVEELASENERLREVLLISDKFHGKNA